MPIHRQIGTERNVGERVRKILRAVRESLSLKLVLLGVVLILLGVVLQTGIYAAFLPIWGGGLLVVGIVSYALIRRNRQ